MACCILESRHCLPHRTAPLRGPTVFKYWKVTVRERRSFGAAMLPTSNGTHETYCQSLGGEGVFAVSPAVEESVPRSSTLVKRKVALHIGYVGTGYQGLQFSTEDHVRTIEAELIAAIHKAGLITDANSGDLHKLKWSRSSRTDKGVHSLSTVVALKVLMDESAYDSDPEGIALADRITAHLGPQLQVFSVQRVNKHFRARQSCKERSYKYYLPVSLLSGGEWEVDGDKERAILDKFRKVLAMFVGRHAFHNYTRLKNYTCDNIIDSFRGPGKDWKAPPKRRKKSMDEESSEENLSEADDQTEANTPADREAQSSPRPARGLMYGGQTEGEKNTGRFRFWNFEFKEVEESQKDGDPVVLAHYRWIKSFTASDPELTSPDGVLVVCCEVVGVSFMLHQIRYMIAAAVAAARGFISFSVVDASLSAPIRLNLPLALPYPLVLADCAFHPFPMQGEVAATVSKWSGNELLLRERGLERQKHFCKTVLLPALEELLRKSEWDTWSANLYLFSYHEGMEDVATPMSKFSPWAAKMIEKKEAKIRLLEEQGIDNATYWKLKKAEWKSKHAKDEADDADNSGGGHS